MKPSIKLICVALVIAALGFVASSTHAATQTATISTDQTKYFVGETMVISGSGFTPYVFVTISVLRPDHVTDTLPNVTTDGVGAFTASYTPTPSIPGRYKITASDLANTATTASTEADNIAEDFLQCANKNPTLGVCDWIGSILQSSDAKIFEGMSTLQRLTFDAIPATVGNVHVLVFHIDATKAASHAYDFITTWDAALAATNAIDAVDPANTIYPVIGSATGPDPACDNPSNPQASLRAVCRALRVVSNPFVTRATMSNSFTNADVGGAVSVQDAFTHYQTAFSSGNTNVVTMWGNAAFTGTPTLHFDGYDSTTGDQNALYTLTWTSASDQMEIEFGAHVAQGLDTLGFNIGYGQGLGASNISGGPYHVSIDSFDGASLGAQDNQLKGSNILLPPGTPTVTSTLTGSILNASVEVGTVVHDTANLDTGSASVLIPAGSTVTFQRYTTIDCTGSFISQGPLAVTSGVQTTTVDSPSFTPGAGSYSYLVIFTSGNTAILKSGVGACEPFRIVDARITLSPLTATNQVTQPHTITATVSQDDGIPAGAPGDAVTGFGPAPNGTLVTFSLLNNTAGATFVGGVTTCTTTGGTCSIQINSTAVGGVDIHATTTFSVGGASVTRASGDGLSGDSANAHKSYVDASIGITPNTDTNEINDPHVFTITVTQFPDGATAATTANITPSVSPAPSTLGPTTCGPTVAFVGNVATCTLTINSTTAGTFTANASATMTIGGITVTRDTDPATATIGSGPGGSGPATKTYIAPGTSLTLVSQTPPGASLPTGTSVTIVINEANTGGVALHAVSVTGGGKCASWAPAGGATTIAVGASLNFSCTFAVTAGATNAWSGDGQGLDTLNNPVPATGEHVDGAISGVSPGTSLTLVSQTPPGASLPTGTSVTIVINEANTGNVALHAVSVTGGGKCASWAPAGGATTIAVGASLNFSCTFAVTAGATNAWSGDGQGLDTLNNPVPATGEHVDGAISGVSPGTSLTLVSQTPPGASLETGTSVTIVINEANTGNVALHAVSVTGGGKCASWAPAGGATTIAVGASLNFSCTFAVTAGATNAWSGDGQGLDTLNNPVPATGEHVDGAISGVSPGTSLTLVSQTPPGASLPTGTSVTIVINEANTGNVALHAVSVTGGGKCASWAPAGGATTIAVGASLNFSCTFAVTVGATNAWSGDGQGLDTLNNPVPATGEHVAGSLTGLTTSTTLTTASSTPASPVEVGTVVTVVVRETNTGTTSLTGVIVTGGGVCASFTGGATTLAPGASTNFTCTFPAALGVNSWFADGHGTDQFGNPAPSAGEHTSGSTTALTQHIIVNKFSKGGTATFVFDASGFTVPPITTAPDGSGNGTGTTGAIQVHTGTYSVGESAPPNGWKLDASTCTIDGTNPFGTATTVGGVNVSWTFTIPLGATVTCTFDNSVVSGTTRTQGFWATHTGLSNTIWNTLVLPVDKNLCGFEITAVSTSEENILMGGFWANIAKISSAKGNTGSRSDIDQARMQMLQQYLAAVLNVARFASNTEAFLATARTAYCGTDLGAIKAQIGILGSYNESGDSGLFTPGVSATTKLSKSQADIDAWDIPQFPGLSDEDPGPNATLSLTKTISQTTGTAVKANFTLKAACLSGGCGTASATGASDVVAASLASGIYTLTDVGSTTNAANTYNKGTWSCSGSGNFFLTTGPAGSGTATIALGKGAVASCGITNTQP